MDKSELRGGADWQANITAGIKSAKVFVLVYSAHAVESKWVLRELTLADDNQLFVVPYNIDGASVDSKFELILSRLQWIYAQPTLGKFKFDELINVSRNAVSNSSSKNKKVYKVDLSKHIIGNRNDYNNHTSQSNVADTIDIEELRKKITQIVKNHSTGWAGRWNFFDNLNKKKLSNAITAYANGVSESNFVCLFDATVWGTGKTGLVIATDRICIHEVYSKIIINEKFNDMDLASVNGDILIIKRKDGTEITDTIFTGQPKEGSELVAIITEILDIYRNCKTNQLNCKETESNSNTLTSAEKQIGITVRNMVEQYSASLFHGNIGSIGIEDKMPVQSLKCALSKFAFGANIDNVILFIDTTLGHNGKQGIVFTYDTIYLQALMSKPVVLKYDQITTMILKNGKDIYSSYLIFVLNDNSSVEFQDSYINKEVLISIIKSIKTIKNGQ